MLSCVVCRVSQDKDLIEPVTTSCGHKGCWPCVVKYCVGMKKVVCPVCHLQLSLIVPVQDVGRKRNSNDLIPSYVTAKPNSIIRADTLKKIINEASVSGPRDREGTIQSRRSRSRTKRSTGLLADQEMNNLVTDSRQGDSLPDIDNLDSRSRSRSPVFNRNHNFDNLDNLDSDQDQRNDVNKYKYH